MNIKKKKSKKRIKKLMKISNELFIFLFQVIDNMSIHYDLRRLRKKISEDDWNNKNM